ncbi:MAG: LysM peptidoglycan-binding domain-containing protein [Bacteroides sp.]|nr:LysM peptidoglycan-binding domain-containing protein [Bacteroidales bacterium]MCI6680313.1 LysM peptidoglycan-binding domain-containing protein [Bacteroides sp.]MDD7489944.1 LysM peptidoglycan-binding domain-containing protein [Bacteroides sp.]MDY5891222.1 LysM peptidoglycan-binding domain-containing protein [Candidatus Cryptobacteroides sp.]
MKKILVISTLIISMCIQLDAQNAGFLFGRPTRKQLQKENADLKTALDSLQVLLDSFEHRRYLEDSELIAVMEGNSEAEADDTVYTAEMRDSLLQLWYKNSTIVNYDALHEYDMDSVKFSSNVSDEEMVRRLEAMNSFISLPFNENVKNYIILYSEKMPSRMGRVLGLSNYYFPIFEDILNRYDLPEELKYMAVVESMLNPTATSHAGAKGIWQFIYSTAKSYGLEINSYVDERMDVEKSMDAAARYLRDAYRIFGDWALAISSYNCGAGNVSKAIRRAGGSKDYWSIYRYLPRETRGYVPAFVGAMYAMTYSKEYGIVPQNVGMPVQTDTFEIKKNLHFAQINGKIGVPMEDLRQLNPQYFNDIIPGSNHSYILKIPVSWTKTFMDTPIDSIYAFKSDSLLSQKIVKDVKRAGTQSSQQRISYKVKSGDYLGRIASRYKVSVNQLKKWNNLRSSNIRVGQILYIYPNGSYPTTTSSSSGSKSSSKTSASSSKSKSSSVTYTVKSGDSLYKIAKKYPGISADNIKKANGLKNDKIRPGQKLRIPL